MRRFFAVAAAVALGGLVAAAVAPAVEQAVTPRQFSALVKRVAKVEKDVRTLGVVMGGCLMYEAVGTSRYGTDSEGYFYGFGDGNITITQALDVTETGQAPHYYMLGVDPECAPIINESLASIARQLSVARNPQSIPGSVRAPAHRRR